ncbi:MAG: 3-phosphoshikimate 1-carboxyvinyltransferase [Anaerolineales bacterium]
MQTYSSSPLNTSPATRVAVPGSKSHTNRALLVAALADGKTTLENALFSDDSQYFAQALTDLGFVVSPNEQEKIITILGLDGRIPKAQADLFIGNAGTAARFLTAMLTLGHGEYRLDGVERMRQRPIGDLILALNKLGAQTGGEPPDEDDPRSICPPVTVIAAGLSGGVTSIRGDISSQFLSGLLMVAPYAQDEVEIVVDGPLHSKPYIDLTLGVMADFGMRVQREGYERFRISPQRYHTPGNYAIESDASAASYFFAAPAICGGWVEVANLSRSARQGDIAFLDVLEQMGCAVTEVPGAIRVKGPQHLCGVDVNMSDISDTSMTLAAIAPFADSPTTIHGIASSRVKETDRVAATVAELRRLGIQVDEHADGMTIYPCENIKPGKVNPYNDHRIAMAFTLIGLRIPGIEIENPSCVEKTFPNYYEVLDSLY